MPLTCARCTKSRCCHAGKSLHNSYQLLTQQIFQIIVGYVNKYLRCKEERKKESKYLICIFVLDGLYETLAFLIVGIVGGRDCHALRAELWKLLLFVLLFIYSTIAQSAVTQFAKQRFSYRTKKHHVVKNYM